MNMISENKDPVNPACRAVALAKAGDPVEAELDFYLAQETPKGALREQCEECGRWMGKQVHLLFQQSHA